MAEAEQGPAHPLERMMFFSDAVFAIAITLLVIGIDVPQLPHGASNSEQIAALANLIPNFIGFFISFAVIGAFWSGHHRAFSLARHYAPGLQIPNMMLLCAIAFTPFSTAYMSENYGERVPHMFYYGVLLVTALLNLYVVRKVTALPYVDKDVDAEAVAVARAWSWGVTGGTALALAVSFVVPKWGHVLLVTIPVCVAVAIKRAKAEVRGAVTK
jgi:TMEM175 potassium channel family protein